MHKDGDNEKGNMRTVLVSVRPVYSLNGNMTVVFCYRFPRAWLQLLLFLFAFGIGVCLVIPKLILVLSLSRQF